MAAPGSCAGDPRFRSALPHGYRRDTFPLFVDPVNGKIVQLVPSLDTPGLDPNIIEPPIALEAYYLRYRVSIDGGKTFLFDDPIVQRGKTPENPFDGVYRGKNGIFMGDVRLSNTPHPCRPTHRSDRSLQARTRRQALEPRRRLDPHRRNHDSRLMAGG